MSNNNMYKVKEEPEEKSRVTNLRPKRERKTRLSTASSNIQLESAGLSGEGNAEGQEEKDSLPLEFDTQEQSEPSPERKTNPKRKKSGRLVRSNNSMSLESTWSDTDKQRLVIALQRFGVLDIDELIRAVPGKSEDDIRKFITYKWRMARLELRNQCKEAKKKVKGSYLGPVDNWLGLLNNYFPNFDHYKTNPIAHAVLLIWKYEKHPEPSECGGIDFKALYEHLYYVLAGYPPRHLNQPTARYLQETMKNFAFNFRSRSWSKEMKVINGPLKINTQTRPPVTEEEVISALSYTKEQCLEELLKVPGFNPFSISKELLRRKAPETIEELITLSE